MKSLKKVSPSLCLAGGGWKADERLEAPVSLPSAPFVVALPGGAPLGMSVLVARTLPGLMPTTDPPPPASTPLLIPLVAVCPDRVAVDVLRVLPLDNFLLSSFLRSASRTP